MSTEKKQHILITGSSGYLGQHLLSFLNKKENYVITASFGSLESFKDAKETDNFIRVQVDLQDESSIQNLINSASQPVDILIHLAAISSPGQCEKNPKKCYEINCPTKLLHHIPKTCKIIFLSTDQVYDGNPELAPFAENDDTNPVNTYGKSKLEFESKLLQWRNENPSSSLFILRSSLMLGRIAPIGECRKQSFLQFVQQRLEAGLETDYFSDEIRCVIHVGDVVKVINYFVETNDRMISGVYNLGGKDRVSRVDLALSVARFLKKDESLVKSVQRFTPEAAAKGGVISPPDISVQMKKLQEKTGIVTMGLEDIVRINFQD